MLDTSPDVGNGTQAGWGVTSVREPCAGSLAMVETTHSTLLTPYLKPLMLVTEPLPPTGTSTKALFSSPKDIMAGPVPVLVGWKRLT